MTSIDIPIEYLRTWIGKQDCEHDIITPELLKRFGATLSGYTDLNSQVPLGIHWCLALPAAAQDNLGVDGHPATGEFLPPTPLPQRMWTSSSIKFLKTAEVELPITRTSTIADIVLKKSATGGPLVFVHVDHAYKQKNAQLWEPLIKERQTIVYRQFSAFKEPPAQQPKDCARSLNVVPDKTLLFRYSAVTFNGHRIHYDHQYAQSEEGYPGLVVHGPLMATLLMNMAQAEQPNRSLREFEFRSVAPAFVDQELQLVVRDQNAQSMEILNGEGGLVMTASAKFASCNDR
jgi:3-methylfumaryl-CoA hydratase